MSLFAGEQPHLGIFSTTGPALINSPIVAANAGAGIDLVIPATTLNLANAVTLANPTTATALMLYKFPAGSMNQLGRIVDVVAAGEITTGVGTTATVAITMNDGTNTRTLATWTTGALTTAQTNLPWEIYASFIVSTAGSSGKFFGHGSYSIPLTAPSAASSSYFDANTAATAVLDLTQLNTFTVTALFGTGNAGNAITQDLMILTVAN